MLKRDCNRRGYTLLNTQARQSVVKTLYHESATDTSGPVVSMTSPIPRCFGVFGHRLDVAKSHPTHPINDAHPTVLLDHPDAGKARQAIVIIDLVSKDNQRIALDSSGRQVIENLFNDALASGACWVIGSDLVDELPHPNDPDLYGRQWLAQVGSMSTIGVDDYPLSPPHIGTGIDLVVMSPLHISDPDFVINTLDKAHLMWREMWSDGGGLKTLEGTR